MEGINPLIYANVHEQQRILVDSRRKQGSKVDLLFKVEVYTLIGAAREVYNQLGPGFFEAVYRKAYETVLLNRNLQVTPQQELLIDYKRPVLKKVYLADFVAFGKVIIEIKAMDKLTPREESQLINYLKATRMQLGLLINFGFENSLEWKRIVLTK